jgi:AraC-like DNA-binding protein
MGQTLGFGCMESAKSETTVEGRAPPGGDPTGDAPLALTWRECEAILSHLLAPTRLNLFHELTGLRLHAWRHGLAVETPPSARMQPCPRVRQHPAGKLPATCETCLRTRWRHEWDGVKTAKEFTGLCGALNYSAWIKAFELRLVTLVVQHRPPVSRTDRTNFKRAVGLARWAVHDLDATLRAASNQHARPRPKLPPAGAHLPQPHTQRVGNHSRQMVEAMLDYIHEHYYHPLQLSDLATAMHHNASYVSDLFSTTLGMTFHSYLEELRMAKAKDLLRNPLKQVREVAEAVGYVNPNHFRHVFSTHVGMPPSAWRQSSKSVASV